MPSLVHWIVVPAPWRSGGRAVAGHVLDVRGFTVGYPASIAPLVGTMRGVT